MAAFHGGMREVADHKRPWVRLRVDAQGARLGPWLPGGRRAIPTYVIPWSQVERIETLSDRYLSGPAVRFVLRAPVPALLGAPNAGRWPDAQQPVFLCGSARRLQRVLAAVPAGLVA
jgi:hypothetical protein